MNFRSLRSLMLLAASVALIPAAFAHDTWLQTNTSVLRPGDSVYLDLVLGNHGNGARDFKIAGKLNLDGSAVSVIGPDGKAIDIKPTLFDRGYAPKEGYWSAQFTPVKPGMYLAIQTSDQVASYASQRSVRNAKTFFLVSASLDKVTPDAPGFDTVTGDGLEFVPQINPVAPMGAGYPIKVKLVFHGKPLAGEKVSFIPQSQTLTEAFDPRFERKTDANGIATFEPNASDYYLIVAHHDVPAEPGQAYKTTAYSATLTVMVPALCPCCAQ